MFLFIYDNIDLAIIHHLDCLTEAVAIVHGLESQPEPVHFSHVDLLLRYCRLVALGEELPQASEVLNEEVSWRPEVKGEGLKLLLADQLADGDPSELHTGGIPLVEAVVLVELDHLVIEELLHDLEAVVSRSQLQMERHRAEQLEYRNIVQRLIIDAERRMLA